MRALAKAKLICNFFKLEVESFDISFSYQQRCDFQVPRVSARLHQVSASTLQQFCDDASATVLIENNGGTPEWGCNPFSNHISNQIVFNENSIASVIAEFLPR